MELVAWLDWDWAGCRTGRSAKWKYDFVSYSSCYRSWPDYPSALWRRYRVSHISDYVWSWQVVIDDRTVGTQCGISSLSSRKSSRGYGAIRRDSGRKLGRFKTRESFASGRDPVCADSPAFGDGICAPCGTRRPPFRHSERRQVRPNAEASAPRVQTSRPSRSASRDQHERPTCRALQRTLIRVGRTVSPLLRPG